MNRFNLFRCFSNSVNYIKPTLAACFSRRASRSRSSGSMAMGYEQIQPFQVFQQFSKLHQAHLGGLLLQAGQPLPQQRQVLGMLLQQLGLQRRVRLPLSGRFSLQALQSFDGKR